MKTSNHPFNGNFRILIKHPDVYNDSSFVQNINQLEMKGKMYEFKNDVESLQTLQNGINRYFLW